MPTGGLRIFSEAALCVSRRRASPFGKLTADECMNEYDKKKRLLVIVGSIMCVYTYLIGIVMAFLIFDSPSAAEIILAPLFTLSIAVASSFYFGGRILARAKKKEEDASREHGSMKTEG